MRNNDATDHKTHFLIQINFHFSDKQKKKKEGKWLTLKPPFILIDSKGTFKQARITKA